MEKIGNLSEAESRVLAAVRACLGSVRSLVQREPETVLDGLEVLRRLRAEVYEDLNQIQHEAMLLQTARLLEEDEFRGKAVEWWWNPRQTGGDLEPDLRGVIDGQPAVSVEATASEDPQGTIDTRMASTLLKLSRMPGAKYYFVRSGKMEQRAKTKIRKADYPIEVRRLS